MRFENQKHSVFNSHFTQHPNFFGTRVVEISPLSFLFVCLTACPSSCPAASHQPVLLSFWLLLVLPSSFFFLFNEYPIQEVFLVQIKAL